MKTEEDKKKGKNPLQSAIEKALWVRMVGLTSKNKEILLKERNIDVDSIDDMQDDEHYLYLSLNVMIKSAKNIGQRRLLIVIMGNYDLITIQDEESFTPFDSISQHIRSYPESLDSPESLLCLILHVLNEEASKVIAAIGMRLEKISDEISQLNVSLEEEKSTLDISDINETMSKLNEKEELISRCLESQLSLARAARYLDANVPDQDTELQGLIRSLREDINGVKEHATYEHDSVRYLQNAILASLNIKQNQIVKVFTIITAVFLPPTLIAAIYGMNFKVMPELSWEYGFQAAVLLGLMAALLPLLYIKWKRWLR